ncbi:site-specific DNA-methyltransferase [uncultured Cetobacterium sp.]|uniref:site-specific DNA-methyltransferase n=1 Tax=uncultured Cetobacterium sp. TaxID=527638 RepID=UPI0025FEC996|nr:site-specific DNA-methyltransferase [uncultured Cetobacterium sp.]
MEKLNGTSMNIVQDNIEKLKQIFPEIFSENKIDFNALKVVLGEHIDTENERYSFNWHGKSNARRIAQETSTGTLLPSKEDSKNWDNTDNLYIEGDNLEVLKLLQKSYHNKVKMIYIDPPYNTGKDFVYPDNFKDSLKNYLEITGQTGEEGQKLSTNSDSSGRYHSDWLNMIYPRLKLARNLLTDDGVIFISIDDNEVTNLKKICDEIFGEENFIVDIAWQKKFARQNDATYFSIMHETILVYSKLKKKTKDSKDGFELYRLERTEEDNKDYKNIDNDSRGPWRSVVFSTASGTEKLKYKITTPSGKEVYPPNGRYWGTNKENFNKLVSENRIWFGTSGENPPRLKTFLSEVSSGIVPNSLWFYNEVGHNQQAAQELKKLFDGNAFFDYPKPIDLLKRMLILSSKSRDIILDFFSGSATTAHATMQLNAEDGGNRKYIMVQLPEPTPENSEAAKAGYKNICEIGKERIRRAGEKIKSDESLPLENREKLDVGFKVFKLDTSNIKEWDSETEDLKQTLFDSVDNIKADRTSLDVLYEILLKYGLDLNVSIVENKDFYSIGGGTLLVNLDKEITLDVIDSICEEYKMLLEIDEDYKTTVVLRDSSFSNDVDKTNAIQKLKQAGIKEIRSI